MTTDRFSTGKTTDGLIHNSLENGCGKVFFSGTIVDQWLDICLGKYTAARSDRVQCFVIFSVFIQTGSICLKKRCHLVNERTCTTGTDTIHTLFYISTLKINDLRIFSTKLNCYICLRSVIL